MPVRLALIVLVFLAGEIRADLSDASLKQVVSGADLDYTTPARRSEEGMPIGNGRMGSLVWTTPSAINLQINRDDVFAVDSTTMSFPRTHSEYASGCAFVDVNFPDFASDAFAGADFHQHLSAYDGVTTIRGKGVNARAM